MPLGRQVPGHRFMIGITSLADASRYKIAQAALQTHVNDVSKPVDGRTFVRPTNASLTVCGYVPQGRQRLEGVDAALRHVGQRREG